MKELLYSITPRKACVADACAAEACVCAAEACVLGAAWLARGNQLEHNTCWGLSSGNYAVVRNKDAHGYVTTADWLEANDTRNICKPCSVQL